MKVKWLHESEKETFERKVTQSSIGKPVSRKNEISAIIQNTENEELVCIAEKNSVVYAAVRLKDESGSEKTTARIYNTSVVNRFDGSKFIRFQVFSEDEFISPEDFSTMKDELSALDRGSEEFKDLMSKINKEKLYCFPSQCHSKIIKKLSSTTNKNALDWRNHCLDNLASLAAEKKLDGTLHNLPLLSKIRLNKKNADGEYIVLVKDMDVRFKYPIWIDDENDEKYKISEIQTIGFESL